MRFRILILKNKVNWTQLKLQKYLFIIKELGTYEAPGKKGDSKLPTKKSTLKEDSF
jgi:hypothetical protein